MRRMLAAVLCLALAPTTVVTAQAAEETYVTNEHGLDRRNMDLSVSPCVDFWQYANGGWLARNPIPPEESSWGIGHEMRDPATYYNLESPAEADALTPHFSWTAYFGHLGLGDLETFSYAHPKFFAAMDAALEEVPIATWRSYLRWHLADEYAPYLPERFVAQNFDFFGRTLQGTEEQRPRWKRAIDQTSSSLGEALGQV